MHNFGQDEIDYGFQPNWATIPVQAAFDTSPGTSAYRDQLLGTTRKPIWQEAEEKERERILFQQQLEMTPTESFALATMATAFHATSGVARIVGTTFVYAGKVLWAVGDGVKNIIARKMGEAGLTPMERKIRMKAKKKPVVRKRVKNKVFDSDSETAEDDNEEEESEEESDHETTGMQSMLALPPHMVGATPRIVRKQRRTIRHPAQAPKFSSPAAAKTNRRKMPNTPALKRKVRFEDDSNTPTGARANAAPNTPAFVFNTPKEKKKQMTKKDEFKMNFRKDEFQPWVDHLHKFGWSRGDFRAALANYELPTNIISQLYDMRDTNPKAWKTLIEAHSNDGFVERLRMSVPALVYPEPIDWEALSARGGPKVSSESRLQQKDGKCVLCRGMSWAGRVYTREIAEGEDVPCLSHHKSVIPYTQAELREITATNSDPVFRRWCQESRWDWLFNEPPASGLKEDGTPWTIPNDDPRLRHIARLGDPENLEHPTEAMRMLIFTTLQEKYTAQDLAAKRFIDGIESTGNVVLTEKLKKMDLERKRRQVEQRWLCVRQVKVVVKEKESILRHGRKRTAADADADADENNAKKIRSGAAPVFRKIASARKPSMKAPATATTNTNITNTMTNTINNPIFFNKPTFTIPAPFDPVEIKKIRLIPPVPEKLTDPDILFKRRYEQATRFSPKPQRTKTVSFSASTAAPPDESEEELSKEELEAIAYNEECARQERLKQLRFEEEELCRKEREEEAERLKNNSSKENAAEGRATTNTTTTTTGGLEFKSGTRLGSRAGVWR